MKTSLNESAEIENFLQGSLSPEVHALFQAKAILNQELGEKVFWQEKTYGVIREYGRAQLKAEIAGVDSMVFRKGSHRSFREKIASFFRPCDQSF